MKSNRMIYIWLACMLVTGSLIPLVAVQAAEPIADELIPSVRCSYPGLGGTVAQAVPTTFRVDVAATDPDDPSGRPWKYRYLWIPAVASDGSKILVGTSYDRHRDELISWDHAGWSGWTIYPETGDAPTLVFTGMEHEDAYLLCLQVMDRDGAVSTQLGYQAEVANVYVNEYAFQPQISIAEYYLGRAYHSMPSNQIAAGQPVNFSWTADASGYNATIVSYRYGWNLIDAEDPNDPGWAVVPGLTPAHLRSEERTFNGGLQRFTLRVVDSAGLSAVATWTLNVIPFVSYEDQKSLMVIDQVIDDDSGRWVSQTGEALDGEDYRNDYWHFLAESGGVADFDWESDRVDHRDAWPVEYSDLVGYKTVLCYARTHQNQHLLDKFRAQDDQDKFVWLSSYQWQGGNLLMVGDSSLDSFIEIKGIYYVPTIFDTTEPPLNGYETSFGIKELPDGTEVARGPLMYHYDTVGISALDWSTSNAKTIYGSNMAAERERTPQCVGIKGLVLDQDFKSRHLIGPGVVADTLYTDAEIDWRDYENQQTGPLALNTSDFSFMGDEFVDANISPRVTPIVPQQCSEGPEGLCIEPMFTGIARFDYVREREWAAGNAAWPGNTYAEGDLRDFCGEMALTEYDGLPSGSARTNGQTYGYFSHKMAAEKPSGKADVYWGFDPYRFDHGETQKAVRWVLDYFGLEVGQ
jgi:hypothetical protein